MKNSVPIKKIALTAVFTALSMILARLLGFYLTPSVRVSFEYFAIILSGIVLGPAWGAAVGALSDLLGSLLLSGLGFYPPLILGPTCAGLLAGLLWKYVLPKIKKKYLRLAITSVASDLLCNLLIGTAVLAHMYGNPFWQYLGVRAPIKIAIAAADAVLVCLVHAALLPVLKKSDTAV